MGPGLEDDESLGGACDESSIRIVVSSCQRIIGDQHEPVFDGMSCSIPYFYRRRNLDAMVVCRRKTAKVNSLQKVPCRGLQGTRGARIRDESVQCEADR